MSIYIRKITVLVLLISITFCATKFLIGSAAIDQVSKIMEKHKNSVSNEDTKQASDELENEKFGWMNSAKFSISIVTVSGAYINDDTPVKSSFRVLVPPHPIHKTA